MADIYIEYLPPTENKEFDFKAQQLVDLLRTYLSAHNGYVDRGDPAAYDFALAALTTDSTWRDLDLSSIVPANASIVHLKCVIQDDVVGSAIAFRENGNSNIYNTLVGNIKSASAVTIMEGLVKLDSGRIIEYNADNVSWLSIYILVRGWFI